MRIYPNYTEHVAKCPYLVVRSEYYQPVIPDIVMKSLDDPIEPPEWNGPEVISELGRPAYFNPWDRPEEPMMGMFYQQDSTEAMGRSMTPIWQMADMLEKNVSFSIVEDYDVLVIFHVCDAYLKENFQLAHYNVEVLEECRRILALRQRMYTRTFLPVLNKHPSWKRVYMGGEAGVDTANIFAMVSTFSFGEFSVGDPIQQLANPPVILPEAPKENITNAMLEKEALKAPEGLERNLTIGRQDDVVITARR